MTEISVEDTEMKIIDIKNNKRDKEKEKEAINLVKDFEITQESKAMI